MRQRATPAEPLSSDALRPTSYDVARMAGVSQSAVSRCFSPGASISARTRAKVEAAAHSLGYSPNALARSLITRRSGLVGFIVTNATLRYSPQIVHDISDALQKAGLMPLLTTLTSEDALAGCWPGILNYQPEAIISLATTPAGLIREASDRGVPVILVNRKPPKGVGAVSIRCDHAGGIRTLTERLIATGHKNLAFIAGPKGAPVSDERRLGFDQALKAARLSPAAVAFADYTYDGGKAAAREVLSEIKRVDAIVAANDAMALGALDVARFDLGLDVPGDISITGFDDLPEGQRPTRLLTSVRQPTEAMAALVVEQIRANRDGGERAVQHLIGGTVLIRASARM